MKAGYTVLPQPPELGAGWKLQLLEDDVEVSGGVFPVAQPDPQQGVDWWNAMTEQQRAYWLAAAGSAVPADAWRAYLEQAAQCDAIEVGEEWLLSRWPEPEE